MGEFKMADRSAAAQAASAAGSAPDGYRHTTIILKSAPPINTKHTMQILFTVISNYAENVQ